MRSDIPAIFLTKDDFARLDHLLATYARTRPSQAAVILKNELARARVIDSADIFPTVVTMHSQVQVRDEYRNRERLVTLVYPSERGRTSDALSILTSLGAALIGLSEGQSITFTGPNGRVERVTVMKILRQAAALPDGPRLS
jgi:regulator of nucleoside diphosphate kinase